MWEMMDASDGKDFREALRDRARQDHVPIMQEEGLAFLIHILQSVKPHRLLEIGTAVGYSAISMAQALPQLSICTLELSEDRVRQARANIARAGLARRIRVVHTDAGSYEPEGCYDFIFVDGPKGQYERHLDHFKPFLVTGGYVLFDNMEFHGMVDHPERTHNRHTKDLLRRIRRFHDHVRKRNDFEVHYYKNLGDGLLLLQKK